MPDRRDALFPSKKNRTSCNFNHASKSHEIPELRITILCGHILQLRSPAEYVIRVIWADVFTNLPNSLFSAKVD